MIKKAKFPHFMAMLFNIMQLKVFSTLFTFHFDMKIDKK